MEQSHQKLILSLIFFAWGVAMLYRFFQRKKSGRSGRRKGLIYDQYSESANVELTKEQQPLQYFFFTYLDLILALVAFAGGFVVLILDIKPHS